MYIYNYIYVLIYTRWYTYEYMNIHTYIHISIHVYTSIHMSVQNRQCSQFPCWLCRSHLGCKVQRLLRMPVPAFQATGQAAMSKAVWPTTQLRKVSRETGSVRTAVVVAWGLL